MTSPRIKRTVAILAAFVISTLLWISCTTEKIGTNVNVQSVNAPTYLTATRTGSSSITITWHDNSSNETGFQIERSSVRLDSGFVVIAIGAPNTVVYTDTTAVGDKSYFYRVCSVVNSNLSSYTAVVSVPATNLNAPTNLSAIRNSATSISLHWQDNSSFEAGFQIERSTTRADSGYTVIATSVANAMTFTDSLVPVNRICYYRVCAVVGSTHSIYSNVSTVPVVIINAPSNLTATRNDTRSVTLQWHDNSSNETGFRIERSTLNADSGFAIISTVSANAVMYLDTAALANQTYYYRVCAIVDTFYSAYTNVCSIPVISINAPSYLTSTRNDVHNVTLRWRDNMTNETGYLVERSTVAIDTGFVGIASLASNTIVFVDSTAIGDRAYYYRVRAAYGSLYSAYSNVSAAPSFNIYSPTSLSATRNNASIVTLRWQDNSSNETGFRVERLEQNIDSSFVTLASLAQNTTVYVDSSALGDQVYYYRVCALVNPLQSGYTNVYTLPAIVLNAPGNLIVIRNDARRATLRWQDNSTYEAGFQVERSLLNVSNSFQLIATVGPNTTTFVDSTVSADSAYYYRISAVLGSLRSPYSNVFNLPVNHAPAAVQYLFPANWASDLLPTVDLRWTTSTDPENDSVRYNVHLFRPNGSVSVDSLVASGLTVTNYQTGRMALGSLYYWFVVPYDIYHPSPQVDTANCPRFMTTSNATSYIDWNDLPHSGLLTLNGFYGSGSYWGGIGGSGSQDTSYADTLHVDQSLLFTQTGEGGNGNLSFAGTTLATFPLIATGDSTGITTPGSFCTYCSNNHDGESFRGRRINTEDLTVGTTTIHCVKVIFFYNFAGSPGYGYETNKDSLSLYFSPGAGLVRVSLSTYGTYVQLSASSNWSTSAVYTISAP